MLWLLEFYAGRLARLGLRRLDMHCYRCQIPEVAPDSPARILVTVEALSAQHVEQMRPWLAPGKAELFCERLNAGKHGLVGVHGGDIAYFTWFTDRDEYESVSQRWIRLAHGEGYLFDSYCRPEYRGLGLHGFMNVRRLHALRAIGCRSVVTWVITTNFAARWALHQSGLRARERLVMLEIGRMKFARTMRPLMLKWEKKGTYDRACAEREAGEK